MASHETLGNVAKFLDLGNYLNMIPFKAKREAPTPTSLRLVCVPCTSRKYYVNFIFAAAVTIFMILAIVTELLFKFMEIEVIVFMMTLTSVSLVGLNSHFWVVWKIKPIASLVNTYIRLNYHLGKCLVNAYSTNHSVHQVALIKTTLP